MVEPTRSRGHRVRVTEPDKASLTKEETPELVSDSTFASKALYDVHAGRGDPGR
jgi:hypothetical protein